MGSWAFLGTIAILPVPSCMHRAPKELGIRVTRPRLYVASQEALYKKVRSTNSRIQRIASGKLPLPGVGVPGVGVVVELLACTILSVPGLVLNRVQPDLTYRVVEP